jgi:hypothetical protein
MLQKWIDHHGKEQLVQQSYERNRRLIDLSYQPDDVKEIILSTIDAVKTQNKNIPQVGAKLMKFCAKYDLVKISEQATQYAAPLNAKYETA